MFVLRSTYEKLEIEHALLQIKFSTLNAKWNELVSLINAKGGQNFLDNGQIQKVSPLTKDDIRRLLMLCHPDKHDGKEQAFRMTQRLLELKDMLS